MRASDTNEQRRSSQPAGYFAETAVGAVVLVALQFLSLPILIGGLALIGIAKLLVSVGPGHRRQHDGD